VLAQLPLDPDVQALMANYLFWRLLSGGAAVGIEALGNYYGGLGNTRLPMRINVLAMVLNVALNWLLIGGNLGAPRMGVAGAALASSLATWIAFAVVLTRFLRDGRAAGVVLPRLHGHEMLRLLRFGFPAGCNWFFEFMAFNFFLNVVVGKLGSNAVAAMNTVIHINSASFMPAFGVASAGAILVGQAIGAGARDDVPRILRLTFLTTGTWQGLVGLLYLAAPGLLLLAFSELMPESEAPAFTEVGVRMLMLSAAWQLFDAAVATLAEALRAAGDTTFTLWARTVVGWLIFAPGSYYCVYHLGMSEAAAASWVVFYLGLLAAVLYARFLTGAWRRIELTEPAAA
jgi:MATE family multidrug resistance protein